MVRVPPPPHVMQAFERALGDLQGDDPIDLRPGGLEDGYLYVQEAGEMDSTGLWIEHGADLEELVARVADQLQEQVFAESRGAWGQARPACPGHRHPAAAELVGDHAMWVCPASGRPLARIGHLHQEERECP